MVFNYPKTNQKGLRRYKVVDLWLIFDDTVTNDDILDMVLELKTEKYIIKDKNGFFTKKI